MFRVFTLLITIIGLYFTFSYLGKYDTEVTIRAYSYIVHTNAFFVISLLILAYLLFAVILKLLAITLNLPRNLMSFIYDYKNKRDNNNILTASNYLIVGKNLEAINIAKNYLKHSNQSITKAAKLIMSKALKTREKVNYLQGILEYPELKLYANKSLAETLLQSGDYTNALTFACEAHNIDNHDIDVLKILFEVYAKLQMWEKFSYVLGKLNKAETEFITSKADEISKIFFTAAKKSLEAGQDGQAITYLEQSLLYKPDFLSSINLLSELYNNLGRQEFICNIIEKAFIYKPSYELFEIYRTCSSKKPEEIYNVLAEVSNEQEYLPVFLKIASRLGFDSKIEDLSNSIKLLK